MKPTSHLDREGDFLIGQLKYFTGALLVISHDRYFLDEIVDKIWELKDGKITEYWGTILIIFVRKRKNVRAKLQNTNNLLRNVPDWKGRCGGKAKQARKIEQKAKGSSKKKSTEDGGRLAHQKSIEVRKKDV